MKIVLYIFPILLSFTSKAQNFAEEHYQFDTYYKMVKGYYNRGLYQDAVQYIDSIQGNRYVSADDNYFFARVYSLNNQFDKTLFYLEKGVKKGITKEQIEQMYDLDKFRESHLNMAYELNYDKWHQEYIEKEVKIKLDSAYISEINDMRAKIINIKYKSFLNADGDEIYELRDSLEVYKPAKKQDSINFYHLYDLILLKGFPTVQKVGIKTLWEVTAILDSYIKLYNELPEWQYIKKEISKEIELGKVKPFILGKLEDACLQANSKPSRYATRLYYFKQIAKEDFNYEVETPEELNQRRKSIGLCSVQIEAWSNIMELPMNLQSIKFK